VRACANSAASATKKFAADSFLGRYFLRIALRERLLGTFVSALHANSDITKSFYQRDAPILNGEAMELLLPLLDSLGLLNFLRDIDDRHSALALEAAPPPSAPSNDLGTSPVIPGNRGGLTGSLSGGVPAESLISALMKTKSAREQRSEEAAHEEDRERRRMILRGCSEDNEDRLRELTLDLTLQENFAR
jgi:hypothetical protein